MIKFNFILVASLLQAVHVLCDSNATVGAENSTTLPPAVSAPRLRPLYEVIETNLTDANSTDKSEPVKSQNSTISISVDESKRSSQNYTNNYVPSSTSSTLNYVTIGGSAAVFKPPSSSHYDVSPLKDGDDGFKPFVPSRPFVENGIDVIKFNNDEDDDEYAKYALTNFKSNSPVKYEIYSPPDYGPFSTYRTIVTESSRIRGEGLAVDYEPLVSSAKFHNDDSYYHHFTTTSSPPKIDPMHRPFSLFRPSKKPPKSSGHGDHDWSSSWRLREYASGFGKPHTQLQGAEFNELIDESHSFEDAYGGSFNKPSYATKPPKSNGLLHILATLIPIGLLLSALPPRVVFINSTNPAQQQKPFFRNLEKELSQINDVNDTAAYNLVVNIGLQPSNDAVCNKRIICDVALNGTTKAENSFIESGLWHLLSRSSDVIRTKLNLQDVYEAVKSKQCTKFTCSEPSQQHVLSPTRISKSIASKPLYRKPSQ